MTPRRYCLPILDREFHTLPGLLNAAADRYALFELWLDRLPGLTPGLSALLGSSPRPCILVWSRGDVPVRLENSQRREWLRIAAGIQGYVDLDPERQPLELQEWREFADRRSQLIVSLHDYAKTPEDLEHRVEALLPEDGVIKVSTRCHDPDDVVRLLSIARDLEHRDRRHIVLGMGAPGLAARLLNSAWSNEWIYAPITREEASAPGQLTRDEMAAWLDQLQRES